MELNRVRQKANELLQEKKLFWKGWRFDFDSAASYYGTYNHREKMIYASRYLMLEADEMTVKEVILHLIAHAIAGYQTTDHGAAWQRVAGDIGANTRASINNIRLCKIKSPDRPRPDSPVARQFAAVFSADTVITSAQLPQLTTFKFDDYRDEAPPGKIDAFLECKLWREFGEGKKLMKLFFQTEDSKHICIEVWAKDFSDECRPADHKADLKKIKVGGWYELLTIRNERQFIRLQSLKKVK